MIYLKKYSYKGDRAMPQKIMYAYSNADGDQNKPICCNDIDKNEYETKYKGHLTCIKCSKARMKYTERKNEVKFFSTWNKEGHLHDEGCPYNVIYKGKRGRAKLKAFYENVRLDDDTILRRLKWKMSTLLNEYKEEAMKHPHQGSSKVETTEFAEVGVPVVDENGNESRKSPALRYDDANYITRDDVGCKKSVYGVIDNVQLIKEKNGAAYAYFNLKTRMSVVNVYLPEAFYENEDANGVEEFEKFVGSVKRMVESNKKNIMVIAYGDIRAKKKMGLNINVISPKRILVDNKTYFSILNGIV